MVDQKAPGGPYSHRGGNHTEAEQSEKMGVHHSHVEKEAQEYYKIGARVESPGIQETVVDQKAVLQVPYRNKGSMS